MPDTDPLQVQAPQAFAVELPAGWVPSVRAIRARLHLGQPRPSGYPAYLAALNGGAPVWIASVSRVRAHNRLICV